MKKPLNYSRAVSENKRELKGVLFAGNFGCNFESGIERRNEIG